jgi:hypothetical protein
MSSQLKSEDDILANEVLKKLHEMIDTKFNREKRGKYVNPYLLKTKMTLWSISGEYIDKDPAEIAVLLKRLIQRGSVISNIDQSGVFPLDAYFIPTTELMDEKEFDIYARINREILK